ncbi:lamin tail domain-containing protein [Paenibacillus sp. HJGM_3]|uniref:lamin tail domain-containing protein n=1 Tax=Paenibacillus sp. HJGM_3 TaxID=3379816 RepID=UPI00385F16C7
MITRLPKRIIAQITSIALAVGLLAPSIGVAESTAPGTSVPNLLITEVVPDSSNISGADGYEFIEVYNNTDTSMNFKDFDLVYRYPAGTETVWPALASDIPIPSRSAVVFWVMNDVNGNVPADNFNSNYGTSLTEHVNLFRVDGGGGMSNSAERAIVIKDKSGNEIVTASYQNDAQTVANKGIFYSYPRDGGKAMVMGSAGVEPATPGSVTAAQVPGQPNTEVDLTPPQLIHTPIPALEAPADTTVTARVYDNKQVSGVKLYYRANGSADFTVTDMTYGTGGGDGYAEYAAPIPKSAMTGAHYMAYYLEASDGVNVTRVPADPNDFHTIQIGQAGGGSASEFLITELVAQNAGAEDYEYVELYNNTDRNINLQDYKLVYENRNGGVSPIDIADDFIVPSRQTVVVWLQSFTARTKTIADFNAVYGSNLNASQVLPLFWAGVGLPDADEGRVLLAADATNPVHHAAAGVITQAWFSITQDEAMDDKSIVYEFPRDGSNKMVERAYGQKPTPGALQYAQVPAAPIEVTEDTVKPVIVDTAFRDATSESDDPDAEEPDAVSYSTELTVEVKVTDELPGEVKRVSLFYKRNGAAAYKRVNLLRTGTDTYAAVVPRYDLIYADYMDYYLTASDGFQSVSTLDNGGVAKRLTFERQTEPLALNVEANAYIRGSQVLEGISKTAGSAMTLSIDGQPLDAQSSLPHDAYLQFDAHDIEGPGYKNGLFINDQLVTFLPAANNYTKVTLALPKGMLKPGDNTISITSGNKIDPKGLEGNNDDFWLANVQILNWNGENVAITSAKSVSDQGVVKPIADPAARIQLKDALPQVHYTIQMPADSFTAVSATVNTQELQDGEHLFGLTDTAGHRVETKAVVDNTAPVIHRLGVEDGKSYKGPVTLEADAADSTSGVQEITAELDGQAVELPAKKDLEKGTHTFAVTVKDRAGNTTTRSVSFDTTNDRPDQPSNPQPSKDMTVRDGHKADLSVQLTDPNGDAMDVTFYQAYKYDFAGASASAIHAYSNSTDREPPLELAPEGETPFSADAIANVKEQDGKYFVTDSPGQFPYHRFDFTLEEDPAADDEVEVTWNGHSLPGRQVTMYTWNYKTKKWVWAASGNGDKDFELKAKVNAGDMVKDRVLHVLIQDLFPSPDDVDFTFAWVSDTQYYSDSYPEIYKSMMQYIVDQKEEKKIIYSIHTGDLIDDWDRPDEWKAASDSMKLLDDAGMPYGVVAGNHDVHFAEADYKEYYKYFGRSRFENQPTYGDDLNNNRDHYDLVSQNGQDFIVMYLGWDIREETVKWANDILKKYPNRYAILATHSYISPSGAYGADGYGQKIWDEIVAKNNNVFMVLCGHFHGAAYNVKHVGDRTIVEMLADYQSGRQGGSGYIRFLQFDLDNQKIHVNTYSPYLNDENFYDEPGKDEFDIDYPTRPVEKQVATDYIGVNVYTKKVIGARQKVKSGTTASEDWKSLPWDKEFSWYVTVNDGFGGSRGSDVWRFRMEKPGNSRK